MHDHKWRFWLVGIPIMIKRFNIELLVFLRQAQDELMAIKLIWHLGNDGWIFRYNRLDQVHQKFRLTFEAKMLILHRQIKNCIASFWNCVFIR